jgi:hypothetical protein
MNSVLRGLKNAIIRLRFRCKSENEKDKNITWLLQGLIHFILKATLKKEYFSKDGMNGGAAS